MATWKAGVSRALMTPETAVWLAGYSGKRAPTGKVHDLWVKSLALEDSQGRRGVIVSSDNMGMPLTLYDRIHTEVRERCGIEQSGLMVLFSHNHCGPVLPGDFADAYPIDEQQAVLINAYADRLCETVVESVAQALAALSPARLATGSGATCFAVNRRDNPEPGIGLRIDRGEPLAGRVDHSVPVLTIRSEEDELIGILFGYACHATVMNFDKWCGDYPGFAQLALEESHPGATAMFFAGCGADQNPLPRRQLSQCSRYGSLLAAAVEEVLLRPMSPVGDGLGSAFRYANLDFERKISRESLAAVEDPPDSTHGRWARRWLGTLEQDPELALPAQYPYPVQVWQLGSFLMIALGGEAVVDFALRFKELYGQGTWISGYANTLVAYIPSQRVYLEGGYEGGPFLYEYGHPAERWGEGVESRIVNAVIELVGEIRVRARTGL